MKTSSIARSSPRPTETFDVAILGGGIGGVIAAARAAQGGRKVLLIEAGSELGGTAVYSAGAIHIWNSKTVQDYRRHCPTADPLFARALIDGFEPLVEWLERIGAPGKFLNDTLGFEKLERYQIGGGMLPRRKIAWFRYMRRFIEQHGGRIWLDTRALELCRQDGAVTGVMVRQGDETALVRASAVVLSLGGFQASEQMLRTYVSPTGEFVTRAVAEDVGDGLRMATAVGAALSSDMDTFYGHLMPAPPCWLDWSNYLDPVLATCYYAQQGIVVNAAGRRFVDESAGEYNALTVNAAAHQPGGGLWVLMDAPTRERHARYSLPWSVIRPLNLRHASFLRHLSLRWDEGGPEMTIDSLGLARARGALILKASTIEALAQRLGEHGVDAASVADTVAAFNVAVAEQKTIGMAVPRTGCRHGLEEAPFYAIKVGVGVSMTYGGVRINDRTEVLDTAGRPIPGLFSTPGTAGGVQHLHYGGALASCSVFGMIAGERVIGMASMPARTDIIARD